jgi:putative acetyltransferase
MENKITFYNPTSLDDFEEVKKIFTEYQEYLNVDLCFQSFDFELNNLDTIYKTPKGTIILAKIIDKIAGCVALKPIEENNCEMKRLYVKPEFRNSGLGRKLIEAIIAFAKNANYEKMKLDTLTKLESAVKLYQQYGFVETKPYVYNPLEEVLYFEKTLK